MTNISIYDDTAKILEEVAERHNTTVAEVVEALMDFISDVDNTEE